MNKLDKMEDSLKDIQEMKQMVSDCFSLTATWYFIDLKLVIIVTT